MSKISSPDTQSRLLEAAASLMWERSYQATSVDDLCQRAEAKKGSFYHFFASKADLAIAAVERSWRHTDTQLFKPVFSSEAGGLAQLQTLVDKVHDFQLQAAKANGIYLGCPFGNLGQEMARQDERLRQALARIFDAHCEYIEAALDKARQAGEIPSGDNRQRAQQIFALLEGAMLLSKVANDPAIFQGVGRSLRAVASS